MFVLLLLLFTIVPAIEIGLFVEVGGRIGAANTIAVVLLTGFVGASLARAQGTAVLASIQRSLAAGTMPTDELLEGAFVLVGGVLLLTPGFLTDGLGLLCLVPPTRKAMATAAKVWAGKRIVQSADGSFGASGFRMWTGGVMPGDARHEHRVDPTGQQGAARPEARTTTADFRPVDVSVAPLRPKEPGKTIDVDYRPIDDEG